MKRDYIDNLSEQKGSRIQAKRVDVRQGARQSKNYSTRKKSASGWTRQFITGKQNEEKREKKKKKEKKPIFGS
jgi:hypothetical protein